MNKKCSIGSVAFIALIAIGYFIFGMTLYQFLKPVIDVTRTSLSCTSPDTWGDKGICLVVGSVIPLVILSIVSVAGGILTNNALK